MSIDKLTAVIEHFGSQAALARAIGVKPQLISFSLRKRGGRVSAGLAVRIEQASGGKFPAEWLRPDLQVPKPDAAD